MVRSVLRHIPHTQRWVLVHRAFLRHRLAGQELDERGLACTRLSANVATKIRGTLTRSIRPDDADAA